MMKPILSVLILVLFVGLASAACGDSVCDAGEIRSCRGDCLIGPAETEGTSVSFTDSDSGVAFTLETDSSGKKRLGGKADKVTKNPKHVEMSFDTAGTSSTTATVSGLKPNTQYHLYTDSYANHQAFTTDASGSYSFTQDTSAEHHVWIQDQESTKFIYDDATGGDCTSIGTWIAVDKTCTLTGPVTETIEIGSDGVTLDCAGNSVTGTGTGYGIYLPSRTGVTVKNCVVGNFYQGISLFDSHYNTIVNNTASGNDLAGILLGRSNGNTVEGNTAKDQNPLNSAGILLFSSTANTVKDNLAENNLVGIQMDNSYGNTIKDNVARNNTLTGIGMQQPNSYGNTAEGNNVTGNLYGIDLYATNLYNSQANIVRGNRIYDNTDIGLVIEGFGDEYYDNHVTDNGPSSATPGDGYGGIVTANASYWWPEFPPSGSNLIYNNYVKNHINFNYWFVSTPNSWNIASAPGPNIIGGPNKGGNFWATPTGTGFSETCTDSDLDGFCDSTYVLDANNTDNLPLAVLVCQTPPSGLAGWWPGDGHPYDLQGISDGTEFGGVSFAPGKVDDAFSFDGANDYIEIQGAPSHPTGAFTIDAWVRPTKIGGQSGDEDYVIMSKWGRINSTDNDYWYFRVDESGYLDFYIYDDGTENTPNYRFASTNAPALTDDNVWVHVAVSFDSTDPSDQIKLYVNGAAAADTETGSLQQNPIPYHIPIRIGGLLGHNDQIGNVWDGEIDEAELFDRVLSATEIQALYNAGSKGKCKPCTFAPYDLVSWWPGDGNANDLQGVSDGTMIWGTFDQGKVGDAFFLDGEDAYVKINHSDQFPTSAITIDAWVKPYTISPYVVAYDINTKYDLELRSWVFRVTGAGKLEFWVWELGSVFRTVTSDNPVITAGAWQYVAATFDSSNQQMHLYVDGSEVPSTVSGSSVNSIFYNPASYVRIGAHKDEDGDMTHHWHGWIDEVELFERALSAPEIQSIYDADSKGKCKPSLDIDGDGNPDVPTRGGTLTRIDENTYLFEAELGSELALSNFNVAIPSGSVRIIVSDTGDITFESVEGETVISDSGNTAEVRLDSTNDAVRFTTDPEGIVTIENLGTSLVDITGYDALGQAVYETAIPSGVTATTAINEESRENELSFAGSTDTGFDVNFLDRNGLIAAAMTVPSGTISSDTRVGATIEGEQDTRLSNTGTTNLELRVFGSDSEVQTILELLSAIVVSSLNFNELNTGYCGDGYCYPSKEIPGNCTTFLCSDPNMTVCPQDCGYCGDGNCSHSAELTYCPEVDCLPADVLIIPVAGTVTAECISSGDPAGDKCFAGRKEHISLVNGYPVHNLAPVDMQLISPGNVQTIVTNSANTTVAFSSLKIDGVPVTEESNFLVLAPTGTSYDGDGTDNIVCGPQLLQPGQVNLLIRGVVNGQQTCDGDGDGVPDGVDSCPYTPGQEEYLGCPAAVECRVTANDVQGSEPGQQPLEGTLCEAYDRADSCVAARHPDSTTIVQDCTAVGACATGPDGRCLIPLEVANYFVAVTDTNHQGKHPAHDIGYVEQANSPKQARLAFLKSPDGKTNPGKSSKKTGSELWIYEPQYVIWNGTEEYYPFVFESDETWIVNVCVDPPEGYTVAEGEECVHQIVPGVPKSILFKVAETGSKPDKVKVKMKLTTPEGKKLQVLSEVGVRLTENLAKAKGLAIDKNGVIIGKAQTEALDASPLLFITLVALGLLGFAVDMFRRRKRRQD